MKKPVIKHHELKKWIESTHSIFEIFEGRYDAYPLAKKWVEEWFLHQKFTVSNKDSERLKNLKEDFDYKAFAIKDSDIIDKIDSQFTEIIQSLIESRSENNNVAFAIAPYLFTWNFQRFKEYFKMNRKFSLSIYLQDLGKFIKENKERFNELKHKKLFKDEINETEIAEIFNAVNNKLKQLGINHNEPVGTAKLLHIIAPYYFPLIDNSIAKAVGLKKPNVSLTPSDYYKWMVRLKAWIQPMDEIIKEVERDFNLSILKLVDEGFYVMSSINLSLRLKTLGIDMRQKAGVALNTNLNSEE